MIVSRLCGFFDEVLVLEKMRGRNDVTPMFRNMLEYTYKSHLVLCAVVIDRVPEATKQQNVSLTLLFGLIHFILIEMGKLPCRDPGGKYGRLSLDEASEIRLLLDNLVKQ